MATIKINELAQADASTSQFIIADDGVATTKVSVDSLVNLPSGIRAAAGDQSGYSVALSSDGSRIAIGAQNNSAVGENTGHVRVFDSP